MKKIFASLICLGFYYTGNTQFSFKEMNSMLIAEAKNEDLRTSIKGIDPKSYLNYSDLKKKLEKEIHEEDSVYSQKRLFILMEDSIQKKDEKIKLLNAELDSIKRYKSNLIHQIGYWSKFFEYDRRLFPAYYSSHAIAFFEGDTIHRKLFENNSINYNPGSRKMILYSEAVNDYLGPVRVGIGFQIKSDAKTDSLSTVDSTKNLEKKTNALADLQNGGGDISINLKLPFFKNKNQNTLIKSKFYFYANTGFSLPILSKATSDFIFNYDFGLEGALYISGFKNRLTFFGQFKAGYYNGNKNFKKIITDADKDSPTSFALLQSSIGFDFMDGYRFKVDLFSGNSFVKKNFPATVTFIVRPGKDKDSK